ncbi:unnamed protein product [Closterium sp. NIES-53]
MLALLILAKSSLVYGQEADQSEIILEPQQPSQNDVSEATQPPTPEIPPETAPEIPLLDQPLNKVIPSDSVSDVYIVRLRAAPPIAGYIGGINGIAATAAEAVRDSVSDVINSVAGQIRRGRRRASRQSSRLNLGAPAVAQFKQWLDRLQDGVANDVRLPRANVLYKFKHVSNAFVARLTPKQLQQLKRHPAVAEVKSNYRISKLTTDSANFLNLPGTLWTARGRERAGEGIVIGIVDTGIWPEHPSFSSNVTPPDLPYPNPPSTWRGTCQVTADFKCNRKVIGAKIFNAGFRMWFGQEDTTSDWTSARDANGHGTWCASAAAGNSNVPVVLSPRNINVGNATGMAPRAFLSAYKIFWGNSVTGGGITATYADVEAAVNAAVADGVDVISLSLGGADPSATYFSDQTYLYANLAGTVVVYAAGNSGPPPMNPSMYRSISNFSPFYLTVGASTITRSYVSAATLGDGRVVKLYGFGSGNVPVQGLGLVEGAAARAAGKAVIEGQYCADDSLDATKIAGKIVLCSYGWTSASSKAIEVASKGGSAMIVVDVVAAARAYPIYMARLPVMGAEASETDVLRAYTRTAASPTASFAYTFKTDITSDQAPDIAYFSSTGPLVNPATAASLSFPTNDILKPDIIGPDVSLWAAAPSSSLASASTPDYAMLSGTSMATPHLAGIAALLVERYPSWSPSQVMSAITTTAKVTNTKNGSIVAVLTGNKATPWDMGAGLVNPNGLMDPGLTFPANAADYYNFLARQNLVSAKSSVPIGTKLSSILAYNLNRPAISVSRLKKTVLVSRTVQNVAKTVSSYTSTVVTPPGVTTVISPNKFTIPPNGVVTFTIRFTLAKASPDFQFGSLTWKDQFGHVVRSVLAVQPLSK